MMGLKIGRLAELTGTNAPTIRYYEDIGLLPEPDRQAGGQRTYGEADVERLTFIRRSRDVGFTIEQVRALVGVMTSGDRSCLEVRELAQGHLTTIRIRLRELRALEKSLLGFVIDCDTSCSGGPGPDCVVLSDLKRPARKKR